MDILIHFLRNFFMSIFRWTFHVRSFHVLTFFPLYLSKTHSSVLWHQPPVHLPFCLNRPYFWLNWIVHFCAYTRTHLTSQGRLQWHVFSQWPHCMTKPWPACRYPITYSLLEYVSTFWKQFYKVSSVSVALADYVVTVFTENSDIARKGLSQCSCTSPNLSESILFNSVLPFLQWKIFPVTA